MSLHSFLCLLPTNILAQSLLSGGLAERAVSSSVLQSRQELCLQSGFIKKWRMRGDFLTLYLKGSCRQVGASFFPQVTSDKTRGNSFKLHQTRFRLAIRNNFFTETGIRHSKRLPRGPAESSSLEIFKTCRCGTWDTI